MATLFFQAEINQISTRKDRTIKLVLESAMEMTNPDELSALFSLKASSVMVAIKEGSFTNYDLEAIPEPERMDHEKSPALRLRNVLFLLWKQQGEKGSFELYYQACMEKQINTVKEKLT